MFPIRSPIACRNIFSKEALSTWFDVVGSDEAVEVSKSYLKKLKSLASSKGIDSRNVYAKFHSAQIFLIQRMHFFENVHKDATLFEKAGTFLFRNCVISGACIFRV